MEEAKARAVKLESTALGLHWAFGFNSTTPCLVHSLVPAGADPSNSLVLYVSSHTAVIHDTERGTQRLLQGHCNPITATCVSNDKKWIATADAGDDSLVIVWDAERGTPVKTIHNPHPGGVLAMDMSADAMFIATLSSAEPQELAIWEWTVTSRDPAVRAEIKSKDNQRCVRFNPVDVRDLITNGPERALFWNWTDTALVQFSPPKGFSKLKKSTGRLTQSCYIPFTTKAISATSNGHIILWDFPVTPAAAAAGGGGGVFGSTNRVAVKILKLTKSDITVVGTVDDRYLYCGCEDGAVRFFDFQFRVVAWFEDIQAGGVTSVTFAQSTRPASQPLPAAGSTSVAEELSVPDMTVGTADGKIVKLQASALSDVTTESRKGLVLVEGFDGPVTCLDVHPTLPIMAVGTRMGTVQIWNIEERAITLSRRFGPPDPNAGYGGRGSAFAPPPPSSQHPSASTPPSAAGSTTTAPPSAIGHAKSMSAAYHGGGVASASIPAAAASAPSTAAAASTAPNLSSTGKVVPSLKEIATGVRSKVIPATAITDEWALTADPATASAAAVAALGAAGHHQQQQQQQQQQAHQHPVKKNPPVESLKWSPNGQFLAAGFRNGALRLLAVHGDVASGAGSSLPTSTAAATTATGGAIPIPNPTPPPSLHEIAFFQHSLSAITHISWSPLPAHVLLSASTNPTVLKAQYVATADTDRCVALYRYYHRDEMEDKPLTWMYVGKNRAHYKPITVLTFEASPELEKALVSALSAAAAAASSSTGTSTAKTPSAISEDGKDGGFGSGTFGSLDSKRATSGKGTAKGAGTQPPSATRRMKQALLEATATAKSRAVGAASKAALIPRLFSVGEDRVMQEYDVGYASIRHGLRIKRSHRVEQLATPTAGCLLSHGTHNVLPQPPSTAAGAAQQTSELSVMLCTTDEYKIKVVDITDTGATGHTPSASGTVSGSQTPSKPYPSGKAATSGSGATPGTAAAAAAAASASNHHAKCVKTTLAPTYGGPINRLFALPNTQNRYMVYGTHSKVIGLMKLPLDGNPNRSMALVSHPEEITGLGATSDGRFVVSAGGPERAVHVYRVHTPALDASWAIGGTGVEPFVKLLQPSGTGGDTYQDLLDYFYFAQLQSQGVLTTDTRQITGLVPTSQVVPLMRSLGFFPTEQQANDIRSELEYAHRDRPPHLRQAVDLDEFLRMLVNHQPVFGLSKKQVEQAFAALITADGGGGPEDEDEQQQGVQQQLTLPKDSLLRLLTTKGERMSELELHRCLSVLLGTTPRESKLDFTGKDVAHAAKLASAMAEDDEEEDNQLDEEREREEDQDRHRQQEGGDLAGGDVAGEGGGGGDGEAAGPEAAVVAGSGRVSPLTGSADEAAAAGAAGGGGAGRFSSASGGAAAAAAAKAMAISRTPTDTTAFDALPEEIDPSLFAQEVLGFEDYDMSTAQQQQQQQQDPTYDEAGLLYTA